MPADQRRHVSINSARWLPEPGLGLAYGTNKGDLVICRPEWVFALHGDVTALAVLFLGQWGFSLPRHCAWETQKTQFRILILNCHSMYASLLQSMFVLLVIYFWGCLKCISLAYFISHVILGFLDPLSYICLVQHLWVSLDLWTSKSFQWEQQIWAVSDTLAFLSFHGPLWIYQPDWKLLS